MSNLEGGKGSFLASRFFSHPLRRLSHLEYSDLNQGNFFHEVNKIKLLSLRVACERSGKFRDIFGQSDFQYIYI